MPSAEAFSRRPRQNRSRRCDRASLPGTSVDSQAGWFNLGLLHGASNYTTARGRNVEQPCVNCALSRSWALEAIPWTLKGALPWCATLQHSCVMWLRPLQFWFSARDSAGFAARKGLDAVSFRQGRGSSPCAFRCYKLST